MNKYDKYKDSGIEWIGKIPEHWDYIPLKYCLRKKITDGPHETPKFISSGVPFLSVDSIKDGELFFDKCRKISKEEHERFKLKCIVEKNDVLMGKAASIGKIARVKVDFEFGIWSPLALLKPETTKLQSTFLEYFLKSEYVQFNIMQLSTFNTQRNISMQDIPKISLTLPNSIKEQTAIANFLDLKTAEIDELISKKEKLLKLYEEEKTAIINELVTGKVVWNGNAWTEPAEVKDSGVEWLGNIPEHWEVKKLKYLTTYFKGLAFKSTDFSLSGIPIIKASNIKVSLIVNVTSFIDESNQRDEFEKVRLIYGDTIMSTVGSKPEVTNSAVGQVAYVNKDYDNSYLNQNNICIRSGQNISSEFLKYSLLSTFMRNRLSLISLWIANQAYIEVSKILSSFIPTFSLKEQTAIVQHIETETARIDKKISKTRKLIVLLQEYKTTLISEVVTGKIKVV